MGRARRLGWALGACVVVVACAGGGSSPGGILVEEAPPDAGGADGGAGRARDTEPCYSGPAGTEGVGACRAGKRTCQNDGGFGPCKGEVVPKAEQCNTVADDDCDGTPNQGCACPAGAQRDCYSGAPGTQGVGPCKGGKQTCNGEVWSACGGETSPIAEDCTTSDDEDCDGQRGPACPTTRVHRFGDATPQLAYAVAISAAGEVLAGGVARGEVDFGGGVVAVGDAAAFVVRRGADGAYVSARLVGNDDVAAHEVAFDGAGGAFVAGRTRGPIDLGDGVVRPASTRCDGPFAGDSCRDVFVAKYGAGGAFVWGRRFKHDYDQGGVQMRANAAGEVVLAGSFETLDLGGGALPKKGAADLYAARLDASGNVVWAKAFGTSTHDVAAGVAIDAAGEVFVLGASAGSLDLGGGALGNAGGDDVVLVRLGAAAGAHAWSKRWGGAGRDTPSGIALGPGGDLFIVGISSAAIDFGRGPIKAATGNTGWVARIDARGEPVWARAITGAERLAGIAVSPAGDVYLTGTFTGTLDLGGPVPQKAVSSSSMFVAKLDPDGDYVWSQRFYGAVPRSIAAGPGGRIAIAGHLYAADFGLGPAVSAGQEDAFVLEMTP